MTKKKKSHQKFWWIKRQFLKEKFGFFRKSPIFYRNFAKTYRNLTLGFLGFLYWPILGFQFFLSGNTGWFPSLTRAYGNNGSRRRQALFLLLKRNLLKPKQLCSMYIQYFILNKIYNII